MAVRDSNGNELKEGDSVVVIKDLKVKGSSSGVKRGTVVKNIHLTDNEDEIDAYAQPRVLDTDLDDTLLRSDDTISSRTQSAIRAVPSASVRLSQGARPAATACAM